MLAIIDNHASALVSLALDAATMRQQAIAQNIANVNTPGYQRMSVSFESHLAALKDSSGHLKPRSLASLSDFRPRLELAEAQVVGNQAEQKIALDQELVKLSENTLQHQALLKMMTKHFSVLSSAINEGKR